VAAAKKDGKDPRRHHERPPRARRPREAGGNAVPPNTLGEPWTGVIGRALAQGRGEPFDHTQEARDFIRYVRECTATRDRAQEA
jgi:hypothetical protein